MLPPRPGCRAAVWPLLGALPALLAACGRGPGTPSRSPSARPELVETLRADLAAVRHPSDGGGRAWIEDGPPEVTAGGTGRWTFLYEAGPLGIAAGGMLFLQPSPFWGWSTPQTLDPGEPGYTEVSTPAAGVTLEAGTLDRTLFGVRIGGRALRQGERIRLVYGAGPAGATVDRFAERRSRFWLGVDGDGDGVRGLLADSPAVDVAAGPPARLAVTLPSTARPGERVGLAVAVLDGEGNAGVSFEGEIALEAVVAGPERPPAAPPGTHLRPTPVLALPPVLTFRPADRGVASLAVEAVAAGTVRVHAEGHGGLAGESNPLVVSTEGPRILWGDLHGHSNLSDGTGTPEDYFRYARDVAALDVAALTDHDHWGMLPLSRHPELWEEIRRETARFHAPGRFVTLLGYEWTSWLYGHRHVLYFADGGRVLSSVDPAFEHPRQLWDALAGEPALTFAHHSAGGPVATDWEIPPDPHLEPVTEVASVHGASEAADSPGLIYDAVAGNFVRDALSRGYRLGFIGSGDSHDGHPGLAGLSSPSGGLAAILSEELSRDGVLAALRARRTYATNGPRIVLSATLGGREMGATIPARDLARAAPGGRGDELAFSVVATARLERVDLVRSGRVVETFPGEGLAALSLTRRLAGLRRGEYVYVRAVQSDGGVAWSSPFFVE
jgi:hypothetical protein